MNENKDTVNECERIAGIIVEECFPEIEMEAKTDMYSLKAMTRAVKAALRIMENLK